ncbi:MAG: DCC1-like thiol-disulfide oxidoreductase family protein [Cyanobacteria bacterium J06626_23]
MYTVIYDGNCNLCTGLVQLLEQLDQGQRFSYIPMQDEVGLARFGVTAADCEQGMMVIDEAHPERRWQGSDAAEEIGRQLPVGTGFVDAYRNLPGLKSAGDRFYAFVRDHRYGLFGKRGETYHSAYPNCDGGCEGEAPARKDGNFQPGQPH